VYTDHKNLTYTNFNTDRVMRWWLILKESGPELIYTKGSSRIVADALSRLDTQPTNESIAEAKNFVNIPEANATLCGVEKHTDSVTDFASTTFPLMFSKIRNAQRSDAALLKLLQSNDAYSLKIFRGGGKRCGLIVHNDKIVIPKTLQRRVMEWYQNWYLCHPGETRTENTIWLHYWWDKFRDTVHDVCTKCHTCQTTKKTFQKYGHLPAEADPWDVLCIDLIGPYTTECKNKTKKPLTLWALTMIDPTTRWFEMREIKTKSSDTMANVLE